MWPRLRPGPLCLARDPANRPGSRVENTMVAYLPDSSRRLEGCIVRLKNDPGLWERVQFTANVAT